MENTVLEKFHQGRQSLGTFSAIGSPLAVESLRYTGLDYVIVDTEHSPAGIESAAAQIAAAQGAGLTALARANEISRTAVLRLLDVGAQGVGVAAMLIFQTVVNIGMCLFVMPVIGLTLPFFSYGGSSLLTLYAAMGVVSGIKKRSPVVRRPGRPLG